MKIKLEVDGKVFEFEREPMSPERFTAICKLVALAITGTTLLVAIHLVGFWVIPWGVNCYSSHWGPKWVSSERQFPAKGEPSLQRGFCHVEIASCCSPHLHLLPRV